MTYPEALSLTGCAALVTGGTEAAGEAPRHPNGEDWENELQLNLLGAVRIGRAPVPHMFKAGKGASSGLPGELAPQGVPSNRSRTHSAAPSLPHK
jgi:NAD(P)-dependent dehydrogenase (short-subunit alcohol dehydrogenase family)